MIPPALVGDDDDVTVTLGNFDFWRASGGVVLKF
jgi:hypothetical protein